MASAAVRFAEGEDGTLKIALYFTNGGKMVEDMENIVLVPKVESIKDYRHELRAGKLLVLCNTLTAFRAIPELADEWR